MHRESGAAERYRCGLRGVAESACGHFLYNIYGTLGRTVNARRGVQMIVVSEPANSGVGAMPCIARVTPCVSPAVARAGGCRRGVPVNKPSGDVW